MSRAGTVAVPGTAPRAAGRPGAELRISVLICAHTFDRWRPLERGIAGVLDQTHPAHEVILVIDHEDALLQRAREAFGDRGVQVRANAGAPGSSGARNTGVRRATGDVIAFLDDDARPDRGWLEAIAAAHADARVLGTGGLIEPDWPGAKPAGMPPELYWVVGCSYRGLPTEVAPLRAPIGANMSFVRDVFDEAGGFAEELGRLRGVPVSCDDTEFSVRALRARPGTTVVHLPGARVAHHVPPVRTTWRYLRWRCWAEGRAKAELTRAAGVDLGLADERRYVARVLPRAVVAGVWDGLRGDASGFARAGAIVAALALTGGGYLFGVAARRAPGREDWA